MLTIPPYPKPLTWITLLYGIFTFFWLSAEDSVWLVSVLGLGLSVLCAAHAVFRLTGKKFPRRYWLPRMVALGALVGAGAVAATVLFMVMKTSLHGHVYPDYPFPLISGIVERLLPWTAAGALVGLALTLIIYDSSGPSS